ncbi:MAG: hypothetical protein WD063_09455 [Pirellulales bacterium]
MPTPKNAERLRWLNYKMVAGRLVAASTYPAGMNISFGPKVIGGRLHEHLQILILEDRASVRYELEGDGQELSIVLAEDGEFSIRRTRDEPKFAMLFSQPPGEPLSLSVIDRGVQRRLEGDSFWHLYIAEPEAVRRHLIPYLELLRPSWQLAATARAIEEALVERAQKPRPLDTDRWARLVDELASPKFSKRQSAQRELFAMGQIILPFLEGLDPGELDREQAARISALVAELSVDYEDTTDRIATWLVGDRQNWLSLLGRGEEVKRRVAAKQLEVITGRPIAFDPSADETTRQAQLEKLRARFTSSGDKAPRPAHGANDANKNASSVPPPGIER